VNKGDGREWKGIKICAGERGINVERVVEIRGGKGGFIRGMEENGKGWRCVPGSGRIKEKRRIDVDVRGGKVRCIKGMEENGKGWRCVPGSGGYRERGG
jgi:hypothetical protein